MKEMNTDSTPGEAESRRLICFFVLPANKQHAIISRWYK